MNKVINLPATGGGGSFDASQTNLGNSGSALVVNLGTLDNAAIGNFYFTLTEDCVLTVTNPDAGGLYYFTWAQDSIGGHSVSLPHNFRFSNGTSPSYGMASYKKNQLRTYYDGADFVCAASVNLSNSDSPEGQGPAGLTGCSLWLEGDYQVTTSGSNVTVWGDQSFNGNTAVMPTMALQPVLDPTALNGLPGLVFTPSNALAIQSDFTFISASLPASLVVLVKSIAFTAGYPTFMNWKNSSAANFVMGLSNDGNYSDFYFGNSQPSFAHLRCQSIGLDTGFHLYQLDFDGVDGTDAASYAMYYDTVSKAITAASGISSQNFATCVGDDLNSISSGQGFAALDGTIVLVLAFDHQLDGTERATLEGYVSDKYGIF